MAMTFIQATLHSHMFGCNSFLAVVLKTFQWLPRVPIINCKLLWLQKLRWLLHSDLHLLLFPPLCSPLPWNVGGTCGLLLTNRIWERWWDVTPLIWNPTGLSLSDSVLLAGTLERLSLLALKKSTATASTHVGRAHRARNCRWPLGTERSCQQETETSVLQP